MISEGYITSNSEYIVKVEGHMDFINRYMRHYLLNNDNLKDYNKFSKKYNGFNPMYDYGICKLGFIDINSVNDRTSMIHKGKNELL